MNYLFFPISLLLMYCSPLQAQLSDFPANAQIGKCYKKCLKAPKYETVMEEIVVKEASTKWIVEPAEYDTVYQEIIEEEGYNVFNVIPSEFTVAEVEVIIEPEFIDYRYVPPVFETQPDFILLEPSRLKWQRRVTDVSCFNNREVDDCAVWCWEVVPARVDTVYQKVVKRHAKAFEVKVPAVIEKFNKSMLITPAMLGKETIPAKYRTVEVIRLVKPATAVEVKVPAEYKTVAVKKIIEEESLEEWVEIECSNVSYN